MKVQIIKCHCGEVISGCTEPECYTDEEYTKDLKECVEKGYKVDLIENSDFKFGKCKCVKTPNH